MRVAITGASGFLGQHVLSELQSRDLDIVVATRSLQRLQAKARTKIVQLNIAEPPSDPYQTMGCPDVLIHLAWDGLPNYKSPVHVETELPAQSRFLEACLASGLKRLVVTGTCFEYGKTQGELSEDSPTQPCTQYGAAKNTLRVRLEGLKSIYTFQLAWLRLFYLFGPGQSSSSLYSSLTAAMLRGDTIFDMSGGEQVRDFLPIREAARLITDVALLPGDVGIVNICSGNPTKVRDVAKRWIDQANSGIKMNLGQVPYSDYEPMSFWGDRKKLNALMGTS